MLRLLQSKTKCGWQRDRALASRAQERSEHGWDVTLTGPTFRESECFVPNLTIDGKKVEVPTGTRLIEAAKKAGVDVPFYCYHPGLSIAGNCRMCLVEIEKMPKLQIACHIAAEEGMVVRTDTEKVRETRKHVLEFLLVNHPVDCPVCDQAGECWLQDYYLNYGAYESRLQENKIKKPKAIPVGPHVMLDAERCILCSRCVRFCDEISRTSEFGIIDRADHSEITVFPGREVDNPYSGNVVDLCPVGALTDRDFRFKVRVWYLQSADTLCNGCARGCNIQMHTRKDRLHHARGERVMRLKPRFHAEVNRWWMCDEGRYGYKFHDHNRILEPLIREGQKAREAEWAEILSRTAAHVKQSKGRFGVFLSPQLSNEELYLAKKLFQESLAVNHLFLVSPTPEGYEDDILIRADKNPNSRGAHEIGFSYDEASVRKFFGEMEKGGIDGVIAFGQDLLTLSQSANAIAGFPLRGSLRQGVAEGTALLKSLKWSIFVGTNHHLMSEYSRLVLPAATYAEKEGTFTNFEGRVQKFNKVFEPLGKARPDWEILLDLAAALGIKFSYAKAEDIFKELVSKGKIFEGLTYEKLEAGGSTDIRVLAEPMIPELEQDSPLIFYQGDGK